MNKIELSYSQISNLVRNAVDKGVTDALMRCDLISSIITYAEIKKLYGPKMANDARMSRYIKWFPKGTGTTSGAYCNRSEFLDYLFKNKMKEVLG